MSKLIRRFGWSILSLLSRYREEIVEKQFDLDRIATSAIAIYTSTAVLGKLDRDLIQGQSNSVDLAIGKFFCHQALQNAKQSLHDLSKHSDQEIEQVSDLLKGNS